MWPEPPWRAARSCSCDLWRTGAPLGAPAPGKRPEIHPHHWDSHHGWRRPQREEELDTAWVSEVGGGGRPRQTNPAAASPHLTPIFLSHCQGLPTRRLRLCAPLLCLARPPAAGSRAVPRPGPCARPGTSGNNAGQCLPAASRLCKCQRPVRIPAAAARPPPPERG